MVVRLRANASANDRLPSLPQYIRKIIPSLDTVFKSLNKQVKQTKEESLLATKTTEDTILDTQIAIVKHIFDVKVQEANARLIEKERKEQKQKIMSILATKQEQELQNKSVEELQKMLNEI